MRTFYVASFLLLALVAYSQKQTVGILNFNYVKGAASYQTVSAIQESVSNAFVKTKRFNIVDRAKIDAIMNEKDLQSTEDFMDGKFVAQSASLGAEYLVSSMVSSANADRMQTTTNDGRVITTYKCKMSIQLKIIDVASTQIVTSETIEPKAGSAFGGLMGYGAKTPEKAIANAMKDIEKDIDKFVATNFPLTVSIAEVNKKEMLIAAGSDFGIQKKDKFKVVEITQREVDGKILTRKKEIGEIVVTDVEDENFSKCSIKKGDKDIASKFESGAKLKCISLSK